MALTIDVSIWGWRGLGFGFEWGRVGHAMISDPASGTALLSQFPHRLGQASLPFGPNTLLTFSDTYTEEGGKPDVVYEIDIENEDAFRAMVNDHVNRPYWDWDPTPPKQTHCARSSYDALRAGGVPIDPTNHYVVTKGHTKEILPNSLWYLLEQSGAKVLSQRSRNFAYEILEDNEKIVTFARQQNLWTKGLEKIDALIDC